jgi:hypothetical protein
VNVPDEAELAVKVATAEELRVLLPSEVEPL